MIRKLASLALPALALASAAHAQLINDNFNTAPSDPNTLSWYRASGTVSAFTAASGALQFTSSDATSNISIFKQFNQTTLAVGETLTLTFTFTAFASQPATTSNNHLRIGLFDTADTFSANQAVSPWSTSNEGYSMAIGGGSNTATSNFFYRASNASLVTTTGATALGTADTLTQFNYSLSTDVTFSITRTAASTIVLKGSYDQNGTKSSFTDKTITATANYVDTFDTLYIGYGLNVNGRGFTIDNVNLSVSGIPEPSTFGTLAGLVALGFCATRRRRKA